MWKNTFSRAERVTVSNSSSPSFVIEDTTFNGPPSFQLWPCCFNWLVSDGLPGVFKLSDIAKSYACNGHTHAMNAHPSRMTFFRFIVNFVVLYCEYRQ